MNAFVNPLTLLTDLKHPETPFVQMASGLIFSYIAFNLI
jgi:hypothetical protein